MSVFFKMMLRVVEHDIMMLVVHGMFVYGTIIVRVAIVRIALVVTVPALIACVELVFVTVVLSGMSGY